MVPSPQALARAPAARFAPRPSPTPRPAAPQSPSTSAAAPSTTNEAPGKARPPVELAQIEAARDRLEGSIEHTPYVRSRSLSAITGAQVSLKLESFQVTGSFKARGALNRLLALTPEEKARGVVAASAGNHAQGLAHHGRALGVGVSIVMPKAAPDVKVRRTKALGADVHLIGDSFDEACQAARRMGRDEHKTFVSAFDDADVIAGQGTIGLEVLEAEPDVVVVPVGGGGLVSGIATAIKARKPDAEIVGVQAALVPSMVRALEQGAPTLVPAQKTLADGIAVRQVGAHCVDLCQRHVDRVVTVDEDEIEAAVVHLLESDRTVAEGAGAVSVAALLTGRVPDIAGTKVAAIVSGGNIDLPVLQRLIAKHATPPTAAPSSSSSAAPT